MPRLVFSYHKSFVTNLSTYYHVVGPSPNRVGLVISTHSSSGSHELFATPIEPSVMPIGGPEDFVFSGRADTNWFIHLSERNVGTLIQGPWWAYRSGGSSYWISWTSIHRV